MKGIILAGGSGTRLYPLTISVSKQIMPIYDKPMIYYPLSVLMLAGIRDILIISSVYDLPLYERLLGGGDKLGLKFSYADQETPKGLADAFIIGRKFIGSDSVCLILGDNVFFGNYLSKVLRNAVARATGATIFAYYVANPSMYGVVEIGKNGEPVSIEEKPDKPKSNYAIPGLYFFDNCVVEKATRVNPSARGELEITSIINEYLAEKKLIVEIMGRGMAWLDTGTHDSLLDAANYVAAIQKRQGLCVACIEEIAFRKGFISKYELLELSAPLLTTDYGLYINKIAKEAIDEYKYDWSEYAYNEKTV